MRWRFQQGLRNKEISRPISCAPVSRLHGKTDGRVSKAGEPILRAAREGHSRLMVAHMKRYDPGNIQMAKIAASWRSKGTAVKSSLRAAMDSAGTG